MLQPGDKLGQQTADTGLTGRDAVVYYDGEVEAGSGPDTVQMLLTERSWKIITDNANATTLKLPSVFEAARMAYFLYITKDGGQNVTITDRGYDSDFDDRTLADVNDRCMIVSDGIHWFAFDAGITAIS